MLTLPKIPMPPTPSIVPLMTRVFDTVLGVCEPPSTPIPA